MRIALLLSRCLCFVAFFITINTVATSDALGAVHETSATDVTLLRYHTSDHEVGPARRHWALFVGASLISPCTHLSIEGSNEEAWALAAMAMESPSLKVIFRYDTAVAAPWGTYQGCRVLSVDLVPN